MNFQPPKPEQRRTYIDGISIVKSSVASLQPVAKQPMLAREAVLAHRLVRVTKANRFGASKPRTSMVALVRVQNRVSSMNRSAITSATQSIRHYAGLATASLYATATAVKGTNWYAFVPEKYKKYTVSSGVTLNRTVKSRGATLTAAVLVLVAVGLWSLPSNVPQTSPIAAKDTAITTVAAAPEVSTSTQDASEVITSAVTSSATYYYSYGTGYSAQQSSPAKEEQLPVSDATQTLAPQVLVPATDVSAAPSNVTPIPSAATPPEDTPDAPVEPTPPTTVTPAPVTEPTTPSPQPPTTGGGAVQPTPLSSPIITDTVTSVVDAVL